jgi:rfaE bifunctional protein kinase chain/domain
MKKEVLDSIFEGFSKVNVLVIGDVMLDCYTLGTVSRISPEAPVPVVDISTRYSCLGGAANVALNIKALGGKPILCSVVGNDKQSKDFAELMQSEGLPTHGILPSDERILTVKHRIIGNKQQLLRIDEEITTPLSAEDERRFLSLLQKIIAQQPIDVIIFEDYDKGAITPLIINEILRISSEKNIPVTVDPKKQNFLHYNNIDIFKPNLKELKEGCKLPEGEINENALKENIKQFMLERQHKRLLLTLSDKGVWLCERQSNDFVFECVPAHVRNIADVSGAGDTVISVASLCLVMGMNSKDIATFANLAGGLVCEEVGVTAINKEKYAKEMENFLEEP